MNITYRILFFLFIVDVTCHPLPRTCRYRDETVFMRRLSS